MCRLCLVIFVLCWVAYLGIQTKAAETNTTVVAQSVAARTRSQERIEAFQAALKDPTRWRVVRSERKEAIEICPVHKLQLTGKKPTFTSPYRPKNPLYPHNGVVVIGCVGPAPDIPTVPTCAGCVRAYRAAMDQQKRLFVTGD